MSLSVIIWIILGYLAFRFFFRFFFRFLLPLFVVSRKMRQQVKQFYNAMNTQQQQQQQAAQNHFQSGSTAASAQQPSPKEKAGDYIDFEEVK